MGRTRITSWLLAMSVMISMVFGAGPTAFADTMDHHTAGDKLVRGLSNVFLGFLEVPRNIRNEANSDGLLAGWTVGLGKGVGYTALRMLAGAYEVVTFPFPLPSDYKPIIEPEFVWEAPGGNLT